MYNEEIKQRYLNCIKREKRDTKAAFMELESLENEYQEDIYCIPKAVIAKHFAKNSNSLITLKNKMTRINKYKKWANENGYIPEDYRAFVYERCDISEIYRQYNTVKIFHTPSELKLMLDGNFPARHENSITLDELMSAYLILLYQGISDEGILNIYLRDLIIKNESITVVTKNKDVIVYKEFEPLIRKIYANRKYMGLSNNDYGIKIMSDRFIDNGNNLDNKQMKFVLNRNIGRRIPHLNIKIANVYLMGMIFKKKAETNGDFNQDDLLRECFGNKYTKADKDRLVEMIYQW